MKYPVKSGFSPTALKLFQTCPYKYYATYIAKEVPFTGNKYTEFGTAVHSNIENYLTGNASLSPFLEPLRPVLDKLKPAMLGAETKYSITKWNTLTRNFFDTDNHLKCIVDCVVANDDLSTIIAFDWKTGKKGDEQLQHDVIKKCLSVKYPEAKQIITVFWYFVKGQVDVQYHTPKRPLNDLMEHVKKVENAHIRGDFPFNPNGLCKQWCEVMSCPHNGKRK